ncbi:MAG: hypothetical protein ACM3S1_02710 [Hyphomicrobiales bacterium]
MVTAALIALAAWPAPRANACSVVGFPYSLPSLVAQPDIAVAVGRFEQPQGATIHFRVEDGLRGASPATFSR